MTDLLTSAASAVVGVVLAVAVSFGIISSQSSTPEPVDEPLVTYGERA